MSAKQTVLGTRVVVGEVAVSHDEAGLPRPRELWQRHASRCPQLPEKLPVPWINGPCVRDYGDWHGFRKDALRAHHERLCVVCGHPLGKRILLGAMGGRKETAGPGGHPHCIRLAVNTCPHLVEVASGFGDVERDEVTVAWEYIGSGNGYEVPDENYLGSEWGAGEIVVASARALTRAQVAVIARDDPWGLGDNDLLSAR